MKNTLSVAALVTMTLGVTSLASAQSQVDRGVAVVDLKYIFDNFPFFLAEKQKIDDDIKKADTDLTAEKQTVEQLKVERDKCRKGTPDYFTRDAQLTRAQTELSVKVQTTKKKFVEREANLYFNAYKTIVQQVESYSLHQGYSLVLRYNRDLLDTEEASDARKVALQLNKPVVWLKPNSTQLYDPNNRDITNAILEVLKQRVRSDGRQPPAGRRAPAATAVESIQSRALAAPVFGAASESIFSLDPLQALTSTLRPDDSRHVRPPQTAHPGPTSHRCGVRLLERTGCVLGVSPGGGRYGHRLRSWRLAAGSAHRGHDREPHRGATTHHAAAGRCQRRNGRARAGGPGRPLDRQL